MRKLNHDELEYFDKIFFEVVEATDLLSYLCAGKCSVDIFYDLYELINDYVESDMFNINTKKLAKNIFKSGMLYELTEERFELLIEEYEQNRVLGCC